MEKKATDKRVKRVSRKILGFMDMEIESLRRQNRMGTAANHWRTYRSFMRFLRTTHRKDVALGRVSAELLADYQEWLLVGGKSRNTLSFHMRNLQSVYNKALQQGAFRPLLKNLNPFESVYTGIPPTRKRAVLPGLISRLSSLDIETGLAMLGKKVHRNSFRRMLRELTFARDAFIFCFCARGLPYIDFCYLKWGNISEGKLYYERRKTGQRIDMQVLPQMQAIIDKYGTDPASDHPYLFPVLTSHQEKESFRQYSCALRRYNHKLTLLSKMLGGDVKLTTYVARHSWATAAYHSNMPVAYISEAMGHTSEQTTRKYLKSLESSKIDEANKNLLDSIFTL